MNYSEVDVDALKGIIVSKDMSYKQVYERMGLTRRKWELRIKRKKFDSNEIAMLIDILEIPVDMIKPIFFAHHVT